MSRLFYIFFCAFALIAVCALRKCVIAQGAKNHIFIVGKFINDQAIFMKKSNAACPIVHCQKHIHTTSSHVHMCVW